MFSFSPPFTLVAKNEITAGLNLENRRSCAARLDIDKFD